MPLSRFVNQQVLHRTAFLFLVLAQACTSCRGGDNGETTMFEERFAGKLREGWSWVRENPAAWKIETGAMIIEVQPGYLIADDKESDRTKNVLLRDLPGASASPMAAEVCMENDPQVQFEHGGVIWYLDDSNFVDLLHEGIGGKGSILMVTKKANQAQHHTLPCHSKLLWLRLILSGDDVIGEFRESLNDPWQTVAKTKLPSSAKARVGVLCGGGRLGTGRVAKFSQFRIISMR